MTKVEPGNIHQRIAPHQRAALVARARELRLDGVLVHSWRRRSVPALTDCLPGDVTDAAALWLPVAAGPVLVVHPPAGHDPSDQIPERAATPHTDGMIVVHSSDPLGYVPRGVARIAVLREDLDGEVRDGQPATVTAQAPGEFSIANLASWAGEAQRIGSLHRLTGLQRAARTGDFALRAAASALREGATDFQIAAAIEAAARARGADRARCLVGMGHSTALSEAHGAVYRPEQPVRLEVNLVQEGFASHAQRTLLPDTASVVDLEAVEVCHEAREALLTRISPGVAVSEVVAAGDQVLADFGLLGHKEGVFGHGLGWDIAEHPLLVADSSQTIQADSVLAVHVGVLSPGGETALVGGPVVVGESGSWELVPGACWTRSRSDLAVENRGTQDVGLLTSPHVAAVHGFPGPADGASFRRR